MRAVAAIIATMRAKGMSDSDILDVVEAVASVTDEPRAAVDAVAERKRAADRERMRVRREQSRDCRAMSRDIEAEPLSPHTPLTQETSSSKPSKRTPKGVPKSSLVAILAEVLSPDMADAVVEHRTGMKPPLTERAAAALRDEFAKCDDPNAGAAHMLAVGWRGFKADWFRNSGATGPPASRVQTSRWDEFMGRVENKASSG